MPRPGTPVIPTGWAAHHAPTVAGTWNAAGTMRRPSGTAGTFNPDTGRDSVTTPTAVWSGPLRVQQLTIGDGAVPFGEQDRSLSTIRVTCSLAANPQPDDQLTIDAAVLDPVLIGTQWRVRLVSAASVAWERVLTVDALRG